MKFLCDRCKTRYSIGDDRVRGKILKIRCKNCANVITVREGMDVGDDVGDRSRHPTTMVPAIQESRPASPLNAAFSAQLAKPPPALEEEWYVSLDGDQSGPFSLAEAQRWVAGKAFEADLHCWSEGFDDWLPVDKVSHFRGLRKKAELPMPPPMPRVAPRAAAGAAAAPAPRAAPTFEEETPKPLFAATMASLEKSASTTLPPIAASAATPAVGPGGKSNGTPAAPPIPTIAKPSASGRAPAIPTSAKSSASVPAVPAVVAKAGSGPSKNGAGKGSGPVRPGTVQGMSPGAAALAQAFDASEASESLTAVGAPPFADDIEGKAESKKPEPKKPGALSLESLAQESGGGIPDDDSLDIGEVSRVVNLKDLMRPAADQRKVAGQQPGQVGRVTGPVGRVTGPVNRVTASVAKLPPDELGLAPDPNALLGDAAAGESLVVPAAVAHSHKRGLIMLIGVAAVLLLGVIGAVVLMVTSSSDDVPMGLGHTSQINSDRPEDYGHPRNPGDTTGSAAPTSVKKIVTSHWPTLRPPVQETEPTDPNLKKLGADEIEDMAAKQGEGTKFCYIRAQKGALGLEMLDLKKISVTLTVDKTGAVTDVQLSDHAKDTFGSCLMARIKGWKFRVSPGGTFRIALAFSNG